VTPLRSDRTVLAALAVSGVDVGGAAFSRPNMAVDIVRSARI